MGDFLSKTSRLHVSGRSLSALTVWDGSYNLPKAAAPRTTVHFSVGSFTVDASTSMFWKHLIRLGALGVHQALCAETFAHSDTFIPQRLTGGSERQINYLTQGKSQYKVKPESKASITGLFPCVSRRPVLDGCNTDLWTQVAPVRILNKPTLIIYVIFFFRLLVTSKWSRRASCQRTL